MYDAQPRTIEPLDMAAIMATENCSMQDCCDAAKCIRDLYDNNERLRIAAHNIASYATTCKSINTSEWLAGLCVRINAVCESLDDPDRFEPDIIGQLRRERP